MTRGFSAPGAGLSPLGLGENRVGFLPYLLVQSVVEGCVVVVQPLEVQAVNGESRPFDGCLRLDLGVFLVGIFAGVLIGRILQHPVFHQGEILVKQFPDSKGGSGLFLLIGGEAIRCA